jgi:hypothetical protein
LRNNVTRSETRAVREKGERANKGKSKRANNKLAAGSYNSQEMGLKGWGAYEQNKPVLMLVAR